METSLTVSVKPAVILKKELAQKTEALNGALKRENQLRVCVYVPCICKSYCFHKGHLNGLSITEVGVGGAELEFIWLI